MYLLLIRGLIAIKDDHTVRRGKIIGDDHNIWWSRKWNNFITQIYSTDKPFAPMSGCGLWQTIAYNLNKILNVKNLAKTLLARELIIERCRWILLGSPLHLLLILLVFVALSLAAYFGGFAASTDKSGIGFRETVAEKKCFWCFPRACNKFLLYNCLTSRFLSFLWN